MVMGRRPVVQAKRKRKLVLRVIGTAVEDVQVGELMGMKEGWKAGAKGQTSRLVER